MPLYARIALIMSLMTCVYSPSLCTPRHHHACMSEHASTLCMKIVRNDGFLHIPSGHVRIPGKSAFHWLSTCLGSPLITLHALLGYSDFQNFQKFSKQITPLHDRSLTRCDILTPTPWALFLSKVQWPAMFFDQSVGILSSSRRQTFKSTRLSTPRLLCCQIGCLVCMSLRHWSTLRYSSVADN